VKTICIMALAQECNLIISYIIQSMMINFVIYFFLSSFTSLQLAAQLTCYLVILYNFPH